LKNKRVPPGKNVASIAAAELGFAENEEGRRACVEELERERLVWALNLLDPR